MSDTETEIDETPAVAQAPDGFAAVAALLHIISNERACRLRLRKLRNTLAEVAEARAQLAAEREQHEQTVARSLAEIAAAEQSLRKREATALTCLAYGGAG
jgi:septal ring factor EnvC (AmiA/AmiB activator)